MYVLAAVALGLVLKMLGVAIVADWPWWWLLAPLAVLPAWWWWADAFGYTAARQAGREQRRVARRRERQRDRLRPRR